MKANILGAIGGAIIGASAATVALRPGSEVNPRSFVLDGECSFDADYNEITGPNPDACHAKLQAEGLMSVPVETPPKASFQIPGKCTWDSEKQIVDGPDVQACHNRLQAPGP